MFVVYWNWQITRDGALRFSLILLSLSFSYQNLTWLNSHFLSWLPVGYILFGTSIIFTMRHIYRTLRWYNTWLNGKRYQKYEKLAMHICLYLVVISIVLSIPISIDGKGNGVISNIEPTKILSNLSAVMQQSPTSNIQNNNTDDSFKYSVKGTGYIIGISDIIKNVNEKDIDGAVELDVVKVGVVNLRDNTMKYANLNVYMLDDNLNQYGIYHPINIKNPKYSYISRASSIYITPGAIQYFYVPFNHRTDNMKIINFELVYTSDYKTYTESVQINLKELKE